MKKKLTILLFSVVFLAQVSAQNTTNHTYTKTDGPDKNPMKGWNSGWWNEYDFATVGFQYLKWSEFEPTDGNFNFDYIESVINRPGSRNKHLSLRLFTDWYGEKLESDAGPAWLYTEYGVERLEYTYDDNGETKTKYITNYNHPNYISQVTEAIEALADRYNNDPRIYVIQLGVLGYWGEWHKSSFNDPNFEIEESTKNQIISVYKTNFDKVQLMGRYPWREPLSTTGGIGFHNDFFIPNNGHSETFDDTLFSTGKWQDGPVGGENPPIDEDEQEQYMEDLYETSTGTDMINRGHYSTMKLGDDLVPSINDPDGMKYQGFMDLHRKMGYNYQIESAQFAETSVQTDNIIIALDITNIGVAPLYYNWDIQFALLNENNEPVEIYEAAYDLTNIMPDATTHTISFSAPLNTVPLNDYKLAVRCIQPNADTQKANSWKLDARNTYILFSNELPVIDGFWDDNNALVGGWSVLGTTSLQEAALSVDNNNPLNTGVTIHPNPSKNVLNIVKSESVSLVSSKIYDTTGRLIKTIHLEDMGPTKALDISTLSPGVYNIIIKSQNNQIIKRFVKK